MAATTARLALSAWRNDDAYEVPVRVRGVDLTGLALAMQIRLGGDVPGAPLVDLAKVTNGNAEGLRVASVAVEGGLPVSDLRIRINKSTLQGLPYFGEVGDSAVLEYALLIAGRTRLAGPFEVLAHAYGSDAAPVNRPAGYGVRSPGMPTAGAVLTISQGGGATVSIMATDLIAPLVASAGAAADRAATAADRAEVGLAQGLTALERLGLGYGRTTAATLLGDEAGFALDAATDLTEQAVLVQGAGAKDFAGSVRAWLPPSIFGRPKLVTTQSGATAWTAHNLVYNSDAPGATNWAVVGLTPAIVAAPSGAPATRLAATMGYGFIRQSVPAVDAAVGDQATFAVLAEAGEAHFLGVRVDGKTAYFDLSRGMLGTVDQGITARITRTEADGTALPPGRFRCEVTYTWTSGNALTELIASDEGVDATTAGHAIYVHHPRASYGTVAQPYLARAVYDSAIPPVPVAVPYDWSRGERRIVIEAADRFVIPASVLSSYKSLYLEADLEIIGTPSEFTMMGAYSADGNQAAYFSVVADNPAYPPYLGATAASATSQTCTIGEIEDMAVGNTLALSVRLVDGATSFCVNGDVAHVLDNVAPGVTDVRLGGNPNLAATHRLYLKSLIGLTRALSYAEQSAWQDGARLHPVVRSSSVIRSMNESAGTDRSREPVVISLGDLPDHSKLLTLALQRGVAGTANPETPARVVFSRFDVSLAGDLTRIADGVLAQPSGFATGRGHMQSPVGCKIKWGPRRGEVLIWVAVNANDLFDGAFDPPRSIYRYRSRDNLATAPAGVKVLDPATIPGAQYIIPDPSGRIVEYPPDSAYPLRLLTMVYTSEGQVRAMWSDDQGDTMQVGALVPITGLSGNETTCALLPDGRLLALIRYDTGAPFRKAAYSSDGGATWGAAFDVGGFIGQPVAGSAVQLDPEGVEGAFGRVAHAHSRSPNGARAGTQIDIYAGDDLAAVETITVVPVLRSAGYCSIAALRGGALLAVAEETARDGSFNQRCGTFLKIIDPRRGI